MSYRQLKWFILLIPTITVGLWEYIRHEYLLPYISMDMGNYLTPIIVLFVTFTLLTRFFTKMEQIQEELRVEKAQKAVLEERERIARDLHDGMAQSLFLLSIKIRQLEDIEVSQTDREVFEQLNKSIHEIHEYVREGINHLKLPNNTLDIPWPDGVYKIISDFEKNSGIQVDKRIEIDEVILSEVERGELSACLSEALINIEKHAQATIVRVDVQMNAKRKSLTVIDNGVGFTERALHKKDHYGLKMMKERSNKVDWEMDFRRENDKTILEFKKRN